MNNGIAIVFLIILILVTIIGLVLFKEARTHRFWRHLIEQNDLRAIKGILDAEMNHWRTMRPPKHVTATVWAGVQAMELIGASTKSIHVSTTAAPEFRLTAGNQTQIATALDTAMTISARLIEMIFYDLPHYRPNNTRIDVFTTFRSTSGSTETLPIFSVDASRSAAMGIDWDNPDIFEIMESFQTTYSITEEGEPRPINLASSQVDLIPADRMSEVNNSPTNHSFSDGDHSSDRGPEDQSTRVR